MFIIVTNAKGISGYICFIKKSWYVCLTNKSDNFNNKGSIVPKSNCASVTIFHLLRKGSTFKKWKHHFMFSLKLMSTWKSEAFCLQKIILIFSFVTLLYFRYFRYHKFIAFLLKRLLIFRYVDQSTSTHLTAVHYPLVFIVNRILPGGKLPRCQFINYIYTTNPNSGNQFVDWNS